MILWLSISRLPLKKRLSGSLNQASHRFSKKCERDAKEIIYVPVVNDFEIYSSYDYEIDDEDVHEGIEIVVVDEVVIDSLIDYNLATFVDHLLFLLKVATLSDSFPYAP